MLGIEHHKHYPLSNHSTLRTDYKAFEHMQTASNEDSRIFRIALKFQNYHFILTYIKDVINITDFLSRPQEREEMTTNNTIELIEETKKKAIEQ